MTGRCKKCVVRKCSGGTEDLGELRAVMEWGRVIGSMPPFLGCTLSRSCRDMIEKGRDEADGYTHLSNFNSFPSTGTSCARSLLSLCSRNCSRIVFR